MTTNVIIKTHSWPVEITTIDEYQDKRTETFETVPPQSERTVHITQTRSLLLKELPAPKNVD